LGCKGLLCLVCKQSFFLYYQDIKLILDCKILLGIDICPSRQVLVRESCKEMFKDHVFCKSISEVFIGCYNPCTSCFKKSLGVFNCCTFLEFEYSNLLYIVPVGLQSDLTVFCIQLILYLLSCCSLADKICIDRIDTNSYCIENFGRYLAVQLLLLYIYPSLLGFLFPDIETF
jgi:hypothetical protein